MLKKMLAVLLILCGCMSMCFAETMTARSNTVIIKVRGSPEQQEDYGFGNTGSVFFVLQDNYTGITQGLVLDISEESIEYTNIVNVGLTIPTSDSRYSLAAYTCIIGEDYIELSNPEDVVYAETNNPLTISSILSLVNFDAGDRVVSRIGYQKVYTFETVDNVIYLDVIEELNKYYYYSYIKTFIRI